MTSIFQQLDQLKQATTPTDLTKIFKLIDKSEPKYLFKRLISGLCTDNNQTRQNCLTAIYYFCTNFENIFNFKLFKQTLKDKIDSLDSDDGKRETRNILFGQVLALSIMPKIYGENGPFAGKTKFCYNKWEKSLNKILVKEPLTKPLIYSIFEANSDHVDLKSTENKENLIDPTEISLAINTKNKKFIKAVFGSKTIDLSIESHQNLAMVLIDGCYSSGLQLPVHPLLKSLCKIKNVDRLVNLLCDSKTKSKRKAGLSLFLEINKLEIKLEDISASVLSCIKSLLHLKDTKSFILELFLPKFLKLFINANASNQYKCFYKIVEFEPLIDSFTRTKFLIKLACNLNTDNVTKYISVLKEILNEKTNFISKKFESFHELKKFAAFSLQNICTLNKNISFQDFSEIVNFLFTQAYLVSKEKYIQQSIQTIWSSGSEPCNSYCNKIDLIKLVDVNIVNKIENIEIELWEDGCKFDVNGMTSLMRILLVKFIELSVCINDSQPTAQLSKRQELKTELQDIKNAISDLINIESDLKSKLANDQDGNHWSTIVIEILISLMTKESNSLRRGAIESFRKIVAENVKISGIKLLADAVAGQEQDTNGYGLTVYEEEETDDEMDDGSGDESGNDRIDDKSKNSNNKISNKMDDKDSDNDSDSEDDSESENEIDDAHSKQFKDQLKAILDPENSDSSEIGSEIDEQMTQLDENLSRIFRERKLHVGARQKRELAIQTMNFRLRLLDFIEVLACDRFSGIGLNRDQNEHKNLSFFLSILSKSLGYCLSSCNNTDSQLFQRCKGIIQQIVKRKFNNCIISLDEDVNVQDTLVDISETLLNLAMKNSVHGVKVLLVQSTFYNIKCLNKNHFLDNKLTSKIFSESIKSFQTNKSTSLSNFIILQELAHRVPEFCGSLIIEILSNISNKSNKSKLEKIFKFLTIVCKKVEIEDKDEVCKILIQKSKEILDVDEFGKLNKEILLNFIKISINLKLEKVLKFIKEIVDTKDKVQFSKVINSLNNYTFEE